MDKEKKALKEIRGRIRQYSDQSFEFTPFGKGEPVYEEQHKFKNGITESKYKNSNKTVEASNVELHISVKSDNNENRLVIKYKH